MTRDENGGRAGTAVVGASLALPNNARPRRGARAAAGLLALVFGAGCAASTALVAANPCDQGIEPLSENRAGQAAASRADDAAVASAPLAAEAATASDSVQITAFDCGSGHEHKAGESLRAGDGGGPAGASWNWHGAPLKCRVKLAAPCRGDARVVFLVGRQFRSEKLVAMGPSGGSVGFDVDGPHWERELEPVPDFPFETLLLVARVDARCAVPLGSQPEPLGVVDGFVGRFASGE